MDIKGTKLSFEILDANDCKSFNIIDTSYYNSGSNCGGATLQIISPFKSDVIELDYNRNGITIINSNNLDITNSTTFESLQDLPDGFYTAKISVCPHEKFWFEKSWYRTCKLECKYSKALLKMGISECDNCFNPKDKEVLDRAFFYIQGVKANTRIGNIKQSSKLYKAADKLLNQFVGEDCKCF